MLKKIEIFFRRIILNILLWFNKEEKIEEPINLSPGSKILIIRLNRIGDALVTTPLIKLLRARLNARIHILADKKNHFVFTNNSDVEKIIVWEKGVTSVKNLIKKLNSENYDAVIDAHDDVSTTVSMIVTKLISKNKIAFEKENKAIFSYLIAKPDPKTVHVVDRILHLASAFNLNPEAVNLNINYEPMQSSIAFIDDYFEKNGLKDKYVFGINISAGSDARFWGVNRYKALLKELKNYNITPLLICAEKDLSKAELIGGESSLLIFHNESFDIFAALISKLNFLFTPDTSVVHLASAFKIPMFGIYVKYNTEDMVWSPYNSTHDIVITTEPNFNNLTEDIVLPKFRTFFEKVYENEENTKL